MYRDYRDQPGPPSVELSIDPGDKVAFGNVTNEQKQAIGHLIEMAVPQRRGLAAGRR